MPRYDTPIPENLIPEADRCLPLFVPDDPAYIAMIAEHIRKLTNDRRYVRGDKVAIATVQDQWRYRTYAPFMESIVSGENCGSGDTENIGECFRMDTTTDAIQFFYNDPFSEVDNERPKLGQWERYSDARERAPDWLNGLIDIAGSIATLDENAGYFDNDVFLVPPDSVNPLQDFIDLADGLINFEIPYIRVDLEGSGRFEVELLTIPAGGSVIIRWDTSTPIADIVTALFDQDLSGISNTIFAELQRDFTQIPPETLERNSIDIEFETGGSHFVEVFFVPKFDYTALTFIGMGGGIRSVTACGDLRIIGGSGNTINQRNYGLESHRRNGVIGMSTVEDICNGVNKGLIKYHSGAIAGQSGLNIVSPVEIGEDGEVVVKTGSGGTPEGNVVNASSKERRNGGVWRQAEGIFNLFDEHAELKANSFTADVIANVSGLVIDIADAVGWEALVTEYFNTALNIVINVPLLAEYLYCNSIGVGVVRYAIAQGHTVAEVDFLSRFVSEIPSTTFKSWYAEGENQPRTDYVGYGCHQLNPFELEIDGAFASSGQQTIFNPEAINKTDNRWRVEISGLLTATNGDTYDGVYEVLDDGTIKNPLKRILFGDNGTITFPQVQKSDNGYSFTFEKAGNTWFRGVEGLLNQSGFFSGIRAAGTTGTLTYNVIDLGSFA